MLLNNVHAQLKFVSQTMKRTKIEIFSAEMLNTANDIWVKKYFLLYISDAFDQTHFL